jgi:hypothetical protein
MIISGGISFTQKKKIIDTNIIDTSAKEKKTIMWPGVTGAVVLVGGIIILF